MAKQKKTDTGLPQFPIFVCLAPWKRRLRKSIFHGEAHKDRISQSAWNDTEEALLAVGRNSLQNMGQCSQGRRSGLKSGGTEDQFIYTYMCIYMYMYIYIYIYIYNMT